MQKGLQDEEFDCGMKVIVTGREMPVGPPMSQPSPAPFCCVPLSKCCDLGFHASLARTFRTYLSAEYNLETSRHEGLDVIENAVDNLDSRSDKHTVMDMCNQVFCPPLKFEFQPHMGDEVGSSQELMLQVASICSHMCSQNIGGRGVPVPFTHARFYLRGLGSGSWFKGFPAKEFTTSTLTLLAQVSHLQNGRTSLVLKIPPRCV